MSRFTRPALAFATCAAMLSLSACSALPFGNKDDDDEDTPSSRSSSSASPSSSPDKTNQPTSTPTVASARTYLIDLKLGQCFNQPDVDTDVDVETLDCSQPHWGEVYYVVELTNATFPGEDAMSDTAKDACQNAFQDYIGSSYATSSLAFGGMYPTSGSWAGGDRAIVCYAHNTDDSTLTRSVKDSVPPGGSARRDGGIFGGDAVRLNSDDDRPVSPLFDVGDHDLSVPQGDGRRTHDSARSVGADFLDDQVARGTRDRQESRTGLLTQALRREGTHPTGSSIGVLISPCLVPHRHTQGLHERHRSTADRSPRRKHLARAGARGCECAAHAERAQ